MLLNLSLPKYVSRGGEKLQSAIEHWNIDVTGALCLDIGASSGGFTDCLLQNGASKVIAVDVGYGQFHPKLRNDPRVTLFERTNFMKWTPPANSPFSKGDSLYFSLSQRESKRDFLRSGIYVTVDLSFISLTNVLPKILELFTVTSPDVSPFCKGGLRGIYPFSLLALIKPQFEVEPKYAPGGVVRDEDARNSAVQKVLDFCSGLGLNILGHFPCPILGPKGNQEEWLYSSNP